MISAEARPYIDASVPVLREHGLAITRTFYSNMFAAHPELKNLFNMGNQSSGVQQQSLAAAVFAYAANIDNAAALGPVIERIVQKHASVGILPAHYPIVGKYLLGAISEVLGKAATPPLLAAWEEAYGMLAGILIETEKKLYAQAEITPGQLRPLRVTDITSQGEDMKSYTLAATDGLSLPSFAPGQYVSVSVDFADGSTQLRQYSLCDAPHPQHLRISVKRERLRQRHGRREPAGQVSNWLHDHVTPGSILQVTHPFGDFRPDVESERPIVLLSAGVGITPMIAVLNRIAQVHPMREVIFAHAARSSVQHAHRADLANAAAIMPNLRDVTFYETHSGADLADGKTFGGRMLLSALPAWDHAAADVYLCGPVEFMQAQWRALLDAGVPASRLHREVFGPELLDFLN